MRYPDAYDGIKKIHTAEILNIVATLGLSAAAAAANYALSLETPDTALTYAGFGMIAASIIGIIASVLYLLGVLRASKDEPSFKLVTAGLVVSMAASIVSSAFQNNSNVTMIADLVRRLTEICIFFLVIQSIMRLAVKVGDKAVKDRGMLITRLTVIAEIVALCLTVGYEYLVRPDTPNWVMVLAALVAGVILIYAHFAFIGLLGRAARMLENDNKVDYKKMKR